MQRKRSFYEIKDDKNPFIKKSSQRKQNLEKKMPVDKTQLKSTYLSVFKVKDK